MSSSTIPAMHSNEIRVTAIVISALALVELVLGLVSSNTEGGYFAQSAGFIAVLLWFGWWMLRRRERN